MEVFECPACGNALGPRAVLIAASERLAVFFNGKTVCTGALDRAGKADWRPYLEFFPPQRWTG
jgi:hypothetical protein